MSETLGSLCDKLTVVELKQWHNTDSDRGRSLQEQVSSLVAEIDEYVSRVVSGQIPLSKVTFAANKIAAIESPVVVGDIGDLVFKLARVNSAIWHDMEKAYEFEKVPVAEKDEVVRRLAKFNLERTALMNEIDNRFLSLLKRI